MNSLVVFQDSCMKNHCKALDLVNIICCIRPNIVLGVLQIYIKMMIIS